MQRTRITRNTAPQSLDAIFDKFITEKKVMGASEPTLYTYTDTFKMFKKHTDTEQIDKDVVMSFLAYLTDHYNSTSSINHHIGNLRAFIYYGFDNGLECTPFKINLVKGQETVKKTYSDDELNVLLAKPSENCSFSEYRDWVIIQTLLGTGIRAATLLNIQLKDICLTSGQLILAHTKNKKAQILPISSTLNKALKTYISLYRDENETESYLFPNVYNEQMKYSALRLAISRYNQSRGVKLTSIHAFRHTFAKKFILNHGDAMVLQRLLGHSSIEMTRRYVNLYSTDLSKEYDTYCPLDSMMPKSKKFAIK